MPDNDDDKVIKLNPDELAKIIENFADDMKIQEMLRKGQNPFKDYDKKKEGGIVREKRMLRSGKPKIAKRGF